MVGGARGGFMKICRTFHSPPQVFGEQSAKPKQNIAALRPKICHALGVLSINVGRECD